MDWKTNSHELLQVIKAEYAHGGRATQLYAMACHVIFMTLGGRWFNDNLGRQVNPLLGASGLGHQHHMHTFADALYLLRGVAGFEDFVAALKLRSDLEAIRFELEVAARLHRAGHRVTFKGTTYVAGQDYDLSAEIAGTNVAVEAKSRRARELTDTTALKNALQTARGQVPASGPSIVFVEIPSVWTQQPDAETVIGKTIEAFLRGTKRVNIVILHYHEWAKFGASHVAIHLYRQYDNADTRHPFRHVDIQRSNSSPTAPPSFW